MNKTRRLIPSLSRDQRGFTLIELLVVVAILGIIAAVAIPALVPFINKGDDQALQVELRDVQTAVTALIADSTNGYMDGDCISEDSTGATNNIASFTADAGALSAANYMTGLTDTNLSKTGATYWVDSKWKVHQVPPAAAA